MTTKVKGTEGIEFPDATVQASAAYTKAETDGRTWKTRTIANGTNYTNNSGQEIEIIVMTAAPSGASISGLIVGGVQICNTTSTFNVNNGMLVGTIPPGVSFNVGDLAGPVPTYTLAAYMVGPIGGITP